MENLIWSDVLAQLHAAFDPVFDSHKDKNRAEELRDWLFNRLAVDNSPHVHETIQNMRLAACIALDTRTGNMDAASIFERVMNRKNDAGFIISNDSPLHPYMQFHNATLYPLSKTKTLKGTAIEALHHFYQTTFLTSSHPRTGYCRCISLPVFHKYIATKGTDSTDNSLSISDYLFKHNWDASKCKWEVPFPNIPLQNNVNMCGLKPIAWVFPLEVLEGITGSDLATELARKLTIPVDLCHKPEDYDDVLVLINYPSDFSGNIYQPSAIHANWYNGGFASYKKNDEVYGRTVDGMPERVHVAFPIVTLGDGAYQFKALIWGKVHEVLRLNFENILTKTFERYSELQ